MEYDVIFYENECGHSPMKEFLDELEKQATKNKLVKQLYKKIVYYTTVLEKSGTRAGMPFTKYIGNGIWELRPKEHRVLFFGWYSNKIVLLHPFRKQTNKTPQLEIKKAEREIQDWIENGHQRISE